jgi:hypothetical protein
MCVLAHIAIPTRIAGYVPLPALDWCAGHTGPHLLSYTSVFDDEPGSDAYSPRSGWKLSITKEFPAES